MSEKMSWDKGNAEAIILLVKGASTSLYIDTATGGWVEIWQSVISYRKGGDVRTFVRPLGDVDQVVVHPLGGDHADS